MLSSKLSDYMYTLDTNGFKPLETKNCPTILLVSILQMHVVLNHSTGGG